ncbi:SDR family oxidoreductase [Novosphingobium gossypii]|uniref:SDR family oxidoreductase n=1 Tax=Novosphingobium gossypii TaxID=1604774 RepID=UPI003D1B3A72
MSSIIVTGASAGIGLAIAERFARGGWQVGIIAREPQRLESAKRLLEAHGGKVIALCADVADPAALDAAADRVATELGGIDAWVNNAMSTVVARAGEITPEEYQRVTATTYLSQVYGTLAALRHMRSARRGTIIQISSGLAIRSAPLQAAYCGAKAAVTGFTDSLRAELIDEASPIALSVVYLPGVNTPQPGWSRNRSGHEQVIPDPLFDPRLCAEAVWATVEDPEREVWVGRTTAMMALGQRIAPAYSDRKAAEMVTAQLGAPMEPREGNLDEAVTGPALIDGDAKDRVIDTRSEFFTSRHRDILKMTATGGLLGLGALAGLGLSRGLARLLR